MGMFDYVRCDMPLPETEVMPKVDLFQTKDTPDQYMTVYTITVDGRLSWRPYHMETVPKEERRFPDAPDDSLLALAGCIRRVEREPEFLDYHGDIYFYCGHEGSWWEYKARFTEGVCQKIALEEFRAARPTTPCTGNGE